MPTLLPAIEAATAPTEPRRKRWTRDEYVAMEQVGLFDQQHLELVEGELIDKIGKKRRHVRGVSKMFLALVRIFGEARVDAEAPINVAPDDNPTNEPEPDVIALNRDSDEIRSTNPLPADLLLVVEIADSTLNFDLTVKADLYARAAILEYWVLDVRGRRLIVHRDPKAGKYSSVTAYGDSETVFPLAAPNARFQIALVLGS